ncbi:hypothetical protein [Anaerococcus degeneri]|uniref:Uncharacterized protein n=1 Tax=Anaerococcus degeneri TaxID=361500 RepID=A0ABS7YYR7_9FIRM|nr:hypothetical protein [Anaerococcus degeneri]MBP2014650.1 hypothetical protein [Anaerococcus degeneri]MCA2096862.1 hypothetical protein [Anaerococcus degeneri]
MKDFIKFFSIITGLFRSIISIILLFAIGFVIFVDNHLFLATIDLLGINNISSAIIKPLALCILILVFVINTGIARSIFKAGENGKGHMANVFFGLIFLACDAFLYLYLRDKLLYILIGFNGLIVLNSLIGLIAKIRGTYNTQVPEKKTEYIEVKTGTNDTNSKDNPIKLDFKEDEDVNIIKKDQTEVDGKIVSKTSQLIKEDTDLSTEVETYESENKENIVKSESNVCSKTQAEKDAEEKLAKENPTTLADIKETNKKVNKVVEDMGSSEETYDPDLADDFKKQEEAKIYDKSNFVGKED